MMNWNPHFLAYVYASRKGTGIGVVPGYLIPIPSPGGSNDRNYMKYMPSNAILRIME